MINNKKQIKMNDLLQKLEDLKQAWRNKSITLYEYSHMYDEIYKQISKVRK